MVVYGENGSGKSSFIDAIEYILNGGKIRHLSHEYSGRHQEKAIPNTHRPTNQKTHIGFIFKDTSEFNIEVKGAVAVSKPTPTHAAMLSWDYRRTVLRQDEVAEFIHDTKGGKYSALLPLLGLEHMEIAGDNLRRLYKSLEQQSKLGEIRAYLSSIEVKRKDVFGADTTDQILARLKVLHEKYCPEKASTAADSLSCCKDLEAALEARVAQFSSEQRRYLVLQRIADLDLEGDIGAVRACTAKLADYVEPLITEKLEVLRSTNSFVKASTPDSTVDCPACGRTVGVNALKAHVDAERVRLQDIIDAFNARRVAVGTFCDSLRMLLSHLSQSDAEAWRKKFEKEGLSDNLAYVEALNVDALRTACTLEDVDAIENGVRPLLDSAKKESQHSAPDIQTISSDKKIVEVGKTVITAASYATAGDRAEKLLSFVESLEHSVREEIRTRSQAVIDEISADLKSMWAILHPGSEIENVRFYLPKGVDKAIDIALKFYGVEQDSPRLTLSEGYRNSLGLCIFLAMAKREPADDSPVFLDDVVVSLDRSHRGLIVELLQKEFSDRQVIVMTHDRDWYTELRHQLDGKTWDFKTLLPYDGPEIGIRWSHKTTTFDDARSHLKERPDSAGNDARKIMDVELSIVAEKLRLRLPYLRAERNDRRMAHDFLERFIGDAKQCFQRRSGTDYSTHSDAIDTIEKADQLLLAWANRASHSFDVVRPEAVKLIDACEKALEMYKCTHCGKPVWFADAGSSEWVQCQCGGLRWRYGKA